MNEERTAAIRMMIDTDDVGEATRSLEDAKVARADRVHAVACSIAAAEWSAFRSRPDDDDVSFDAAEIARLAADVVQAVDDRLRGSA